MQCPVNINYYYLIKYLRFVYLISYINIILESKFFYIFNILVFLELF